VFSPGKWRIGPALLQNSRLRRGLSFPRRCQATRIWISAVWRSMLAGLPPAIAGERDAGAVHQQVERTIGTAAGAPLMRRDAVRPDQSVAR
jgi:hypothetical protein